MALHPHLSSCSKDPKPACSSFQRGVALFELRALASMASAQETSSPPLRRAVETTRDALANGSTTWTLHLILGFIFHRPRRFVERFPGQAARDGRLIVPEEENDREIRHMRVGNMLTTRHHRYHDVWAFF